MNQSTYIQKGRLLTRNQGISRVTSSVIQEMNSQNKSSNPQTYPTHKKKSIQQHHDAYLHSHTQSTHFHTLVSSKSSSLSCSTNLNSTPNGTNSALNKITPPHSLKSSNYNYNLNTNHNSHLQTQTRSKVFVSRHNQSLNITSAIISDYCANHGINPQSDDIRITSSHVILKECPFCNKPTNGKMDNLFKLYIQIGGGAYFCHRCGCKGSWYDFKMALGGFAVHDAMQDAAATATANSSSSSSASTNSQYFPNANPSSSSSSSSSISMGNHRHKNLSLDITPLPMPSPKLQATYITNLLDNPKRNTSSKALDYLVNVRGLTKATLRKYGVGLGYYRFPSLDVGKKGKYVEADCVTFPWIMRGSDVQEQEALRGCFFPVQRDQEETGTNTTTTTTTTTNTITEDEKDDTQKEDEEEEDEFENSSNQKGPFITRRIKVRAINNKGWQRLDPAGGGWGLFGFHTIPDHATEIILTEGEYDAMAVYQATKRPAISLPNGCRSLPVEVLPMLERFDTIYLWMDNDQPGREGAEQFAKKIGMARCKLVQPPSILADGRVGPKDANEALLMGLDLDQFIREATVVKHERILTFDDLRGQVLHEIMNPNEYAGVEVKSLPGLTKIVKGFRRGEVTVLSGPTGSGKTTLLSQLSLDFSESGINTLWGSFEIKNTRLLRKLLTQFACKEPNASMSMEELSAMADRFSALPLYFMKFHGGSDIDDVVDAMEYAAYVHDVQHIILDNLQFMISRNSASARFSTFDKFDMQDIAIEKFRKFATEKNVHVTLVVHPRKEEENGTLGMASIYGSAKATQEADLVLLLQHDGNRKWIDVKKNRFDGTLGRCPLHYILESGRYTDQADTTLKPQVNVPKITPNVLRTPIRSLPKNEKSRFSSIEY